MKRELKHLLKKHIDIVKKLYPEVYIEVEMIGDDILVSIDSHEISDRDDYINLMYSFTKEYDSKGYFDVYWGVDSALTQDNLTFFENLNKKPKKENFAAVS